VAELSNLGDEDAPTVFYARVSSHNPKTDLQITLNKILEVLIEIRNHVTGTQD
jgi:predicted site-specific integrase-resolvase